MNGRNTGGSISAVTKSGTNDISGAVWYYTGGGDGGLAQKKSRTGEEQTAVPAQTQIGARIGLPIIKDKLLFFAVFDRYTTQDVPDPRNQGFLDFSNSVFSGTADAEGFYGFTQAEAEAVLAAGNAKGYDGGSISTITRDVVTQNIFTRLDYNINDKHTASLRVNILDFSRSNENFFGHGNGSSVADGNAFGTSTTAYTFLNKDTKIIGSLRSQFGKILNNFKFQYITTARENAPDGSDQEVRAYVGVGSSGKHIGFGQHTWVPEVAKSTSFQIIDDVTLSTDNVIWTFGTNNQFYTQSDRFPHWTAPVVVFDNTADLNADRPSFYRQLISVKPEVDLSKPVEYSIAEIGFYAQAEFNLLDNIKAEVGLRYDAWIYGGDKPLANPALLNSGLKFRGEKLDNTYQINDANNLQPRLQLTWDVKGDGKSIVKFGSGVFVGPITTQPISFVYTGDGVARQEIILKGTDNILAATGGGDYTNKANWLSTRVANGSFQPGAAVSGVTLIDPNFQMPQIFKTSLSYTRFLSSKVKVGLSGFYNVTWNQMYHQDVNRESDGVNPIDGREVVKRANDNFGDVLVITNADYKARYWSLVFDFQATIGKDGLFSFSYSRSRAFGGTSYTAGGDRGEFIASRYTSDRFRDRENSFASGSGDKVVFVFASPQFKGFNIGLSVLAAQQRRFTITTGGNPSASPNTLAVAYIPNASLNDTAYQQMLANAAPEVRRVLEDYQGQIAPVNAGIQPWLFQTSMSISKRFKVYDKYGVTLRADIFNVLNLMSHRAGYYNQVAVDNTRENTEQVMQMFNWQNGRYHANPTKGVYRQEGQPYNIQIGIKVDF